MDENQTPVSNNGNISPPDEKQTETSAGERVYDFTSDLNISPINNDAESTSQLPNSIQKKPFPNASNQSYKTSPIKPITKTETPIAPKTGFTNFLDGNKTPSEVKKDLGYGDSIDTRGQAKPDTAASPYTTSTPTPSPEATPKISVTKPTLASALSAESKPQADQPSKPREPDIEKAIRTYEGDIAAAMAKKNISGATIVAAEDQRKNAPKKFEKPKPASTFVPVEMQMPIKVPNMEPVEKPAPVSDFVVSQFPKPAPEPTPLPTFDHVQAFETEIKEIEIPKEATIPTNVPLSKTISPVKQFPLITIEDPRIIEPEHTGSGKIKRVLTIALIVVFVIGGVGAGFYFYKQIPKNASPGGIVQNSVQASSIVDSTTLISIDNLSAKDIKLRIQNEVGKPSLPNTIKQIIFQKNGITVTAPEMLAIMGIVVPDTLERSMTPEWILGIYSNNHSTKEVFVMTTNNFFQNAFSGMLSWENSIIGDLGFLLPTRLNAIGSLNNASSTEESEYYRLKGHFVDGLVENKDVREYKIDNGSVILLYSFVNNQTLVFAENELTLKEIINRLEKQSFKR